MISDSVVGEMNEIIIAPVSQNEIVFSYQDFEIEVMDEMKSLVSLIKEGPKYEHEKKYFKAGGHVCLPKALIGALGNCFLQVCAGQRLARPEQHKIFR